MTPGVLYQWVLAGPDAAESVAALGDGPLCQLSGWLAQDFDENEATGRILGLCLVEQAERFAARVANIEHRTANIEHRREETEA